MKRDAGNDTTREATANVDWSEEDEHALHAARAAGTYLNHTLNNTLQSVMYRAELLRDHDDPQVAEAGRFLAECVRAMSDTVKMVRTLRRFATIPYLGTEPMLDPSCLAEVDEWSS